MGITEREIIEAYNVMYDEMYGEEELARGQKGSLPNENLVGLLTVARVLKRVMEKCAIEVACSIDQIRPPNLTLSQANAIIDMEDIGYSEGLGPETSLSNEAWDEMLLWAEAATGRKAVRDR
jgi:hypothetical protein